MEFTNLVAYCKGFYVHRPGDVPEMWKDFAHCIAADGYICFSKEDVVRFCLNFVDRYTREFPNDAWRASFSTLYGKMTENKSIINISKRYSPLATKVDDADLLIWTFRDFVRYSMDDKHFNEGVIPNAEVLPLFPDVSETLWNKITSKYSEQTVSTSYDEIEKRLKY